MLAFYAGIIVAFPILFYFLAEFLLPALTRKEKKYVLPAAGVGFGLFLTGVLLCFVYVLPVTLRWLHDDAISLGVDPVWTANAYFGFITHLCIAVGLICELPVVMATLSGIGLISFAWLKSMRMYGYAFALVLAGVISPTPDLFMLFIFALPTMLLFEGCIWLVWLLEKRRAKREEAVAAHREPERSHAPPVEQQQYEPHEEHHGYHDEHHDYHDEHHGVDDFHQQDPHGSEGGEAAPAVIPPAVSNKPTEREKAVAAIKAAEAGESREPVPPSALSPAVSDYVPPTYLMLP
jgi:Tat protein translocase TatC